MIGRLESVVLDSKDPHKLAQFYAELLGARIETEEQAWVTIRDQDGRQVSFQRAPQHRAPAFPDPTGSQQLHLDVRVDDPDRAERQVLELGATRRPMLSRTTRSASSAIRRAIRSA